MRWKISFWTSADEWGEELVRDENTLEKKWVCSGRGDNYDDLMDRISTNELGVLQFSFNEGIDSLSWHGP